MRTLRSFDGFPLNLSNFYGGCAILLLLVVVVTLLFLLNRKSRSLLASSLISDSSNLNPRVYNCRTSNTVTDADLKFLMDEILNQNHKWEDVIDKTNHHLCYKAKSTKPKNGPLKYWSMTVFNDISAEMLRNFYMDNHYRKQWRRGARVLKWSQVSTHVKGQPHEVAESSGIVAIWLIPLHFSFAFQFPLQRFLQCQLKTGVIAWVSLLGLVVNVVLSWLLVYVWDFGLIGAAIALDVSWWVLVIGMFGYTVCGGCPLTWNGFSMEAFCGLWEFFKLSLASGVMLCLENWYYRILLLMTGRLENATIAVDALSVCMTINGWEMMIPFAFFAGTGVRVANELGAGKWKSAKFAMQVSLVQSTVIGLIFCILIVIFKREFAYIFTSSTHVLQTVNDMSILLGVSIVLNSVQPVLSGVAVGSGWQVFVAYINIGCYYLIGLPLGIIMGWVFNTGVEGIWGGMLFGGTLIQTLILIIITVRCDWEKEAEKANSRVNKGSVIKPNDQLQMID